MKPRGVIWADWTGMPRQDLMGYKKSWEMVMVIVVSAKTGDWRRERRECRAQGAVDMWGSGADKLDWFG